MVEDILTAQQWSVAVRAAVALMWSAGLRVHECVFPTRAAAGSDAQWVARRDDVTMGAGASHFTFRLRRSKSDPTNSGFSVVAATMHAVDGRPHVLCPVTWMQRLLALRPVSHDAPLFAEPHGALVTRADIVRAVKWAASRRGADPRRYSTHSLRIGAATALAQNGATPEMLRTWGRWTREACVARYVRLTPQRQALIAAALAKG